MRGILLALAGIGALAFLVFGYMSSRYENDPFAAMGGVVTAAKAYAAWLLVAGFANALAPLAGMRARWAGIAFVLTAVITPNAYIAGESMANHLDRRDVEARMRRAEMLVPALTRYRQAHAAYPAAIDIPADLRAPWPSDAQPFLSPVRYERRTRHAVELVFSDGWYDYYFDPDVGVWRSRD